MSLENQFPDSSNPNGGLRGQTVLVTRPAGQSEALCEHLEQLGAAVVLHPVIEITLPDDLTELDRCIRRLGEETNRDQADFGGWVVFVSANGVTHFFSRLNQLGGSPKFLDGCQVAAIGSATLAQLKAQGIEGVVTPSTSNSESLAELIIEKSARQHVLIVRADRGSDVLSTQLTAAAVEFEEVVAYRSRDVKSADPAVLKMLSDRKIDWVTMTSSAIAASSINLFGNEIINSGGQIKTVSISPKTSQTMRELGFEPDAEATDFNMLGIVAAMQKAN